MKRTSPVFHLTTLDVDKAIADVSMLIPRKAALCASLSARKLAPMEVREVPKADFITPELDTFLRFLKVNSIRTAMYRYEYYDEHQLELLFRLPEANINLFERRPIGTRNWYSGYQPEESDYANNLNYTEYVRQSVNPDLPRTLWLYALLEGHAVACRMQDDWLERTGLPNVQTLMQSASNSGKYGNYEQGIIRFQFEYTGSTAPYTGSAHFGGDAKIIGLQRPADAPAPPPVPQADPDAAYRRILNNIEKGRHYQN